MQFLFGMIVGVLLCAIWFVIEIMRAIDPVPQAPRFDGSFFE